jgi:hypothetical protein
VYGGDLERVGKISPLMIIAYIHRFSHITDEYMCPIFVGDVAEPTNIWGVGVMGIARP